MPEVETQRKVDGSAGFYTETELATLINPAKPLSPRTLRRWAEMRSGPPRISFGKQILYRAESVHEWLKSLETASPILPTSRQRRAR